MLPWACAVERLDGKSLLRVSGAIDFSTVEIFRRALREIVAVGGQIVVDLRNVSYMDFTGILALESVTKATVDLTVIVPRLLRRVAAIAGLDKMLVLQDAGPA